MGLEAGAGFRAYIYKGSGIHPIHARIIPLSPICREPIKPLDNPSKPL